MYIGRNAFFFSFRYRLSPASFVPPNCSVDIWIPEESKAPMDDRGKKNAKEFPLAADMSNERVRFNGKVLQ